MCAQSTKNTDANKNTKIEMEIEALVCIRSASFAAYRTSKAYIEGPPDVKPSSTPVSRLRKKVSVTRV